MRRHIVAAVLFAMLTGTAGSAAAQGHIVIFNNNLPGVGFNDPTPAAPVGGNPGTTLGQQRINVFLKAASIWEAKIKPKNDILVLAAFSPLGANVLGSAGAIQVFRDFEGAELPGTWYPVALANQLAGVDLVPCPVPLENADCFDIAANFSSQFNFYMGFDNNDGPGQQDLLVVILHEIGHGLGFANFVNEGTGKLFDNKPDVYSQYTLDVSTDKTWNQMLTDADRKASAINIRHVSWNGVNVTKAVPAVLAPGEPTMFVLSSATPAAPIAIGDASFGAPLTAAGITGEVVLALDETNAAGPSATDGCTPIVNNIAGKIALMDRGTCGFIVKVKNAQNAGAIAALIGDNVVNLPAPGLGGADPTITISSARISLPDANAIKASLPSGSVHVRIGVDPSVIAGTDRVKGLLMLAAFNPVIAGSSISHVEPVAFPNQLMEPAINVDLTSALDTPQDLTTKLLTDIGWFSDFDGVPGGVDSCTGSDTRKTVVVGTCDSGVANTVQKDGCSLSDVISRCSGAANHGAYVSCVAQASNALKDAGLISGNGKGKIQSCAAGNAR